MNKPAAYKVVRRLVVGEAAVLYECSSDDGPVMVRVSRATAPLEVRDGSRPPRHHAHTSP
jgi:hypothetical protein